MLKKITLYSGTGRAAHTFVVESHSITSRPGFGTGDILYSNNVMTG